MAARNEHLGRRAPRNVPGVEQIYNYADLGVFLTHLREEHGGPTYRLMERRAEATMNQFGRLPHSTAHRIAIRKTRPSLPQMQAFLIGCGIPVQRHGPLVRAWQRAAAQLQEDLAGQARGRNGGEYIRLQADLDMSARVHEQGAIQLVRDMGYTPMEAFQGYTRSWSVRCRSCGYARRIRLDWETERLQRPEGSKSMPCGCRTGFVPAQAFG